MKFPISPADVTSGWLEKMRSDQRRARTRQARHKDGIVRLVGRFSLAGAAMAAQAQCHWRPRRAACAASACRARANQTISRDRRNLRRSCASAWPRCSERQPSASGMANCFSSLGNYVVGCALLAQLHQGLPRFVVQRRRISAPPHRRSRLFETAEIFQRLTEFVEDSACSWAQADKGAELRERRRRRSAADAKRHRRAEKRARVIWIFLRRSRREHSRIAAKR
jgi:hypothetical protein